MFENFDPYIMENASDLSKYGIQGHLTITILLYSLRVGDYSLTTTPSACECFKFTPEYAHCYATFYGFSHSTQHLCLGFNSLSANTPEFRFWRSVGPDYDFFLRRYVFGCVGTF